MGTGNKVEMLIAICAVLTSAIAVFIAWDQGRVMRAAAWCCLSRDPDRRICFNECRHSLYGYPCFQ